MALDTFVSGGAGGKRRGRGRGAGGALGWAEPSRDGCGGGFSTEARAGAMFLGECEGGELTIL